MTRKKPFINLAAEYNDVQLSAITVPDKKEK